MDDLWLTLRLGCSVLAAVYAYGFAVMAWRTWRDPYYETDRLDALRRRDDARCLSRWLARREGGQ